MASTTTKRTRDMLTDEELSVLCYELSQLNQSGISWTESASLLLSDNPSRRIRLALEALRLKTTDGSTFTAVLQATGLFPSYCIHMLEIGELTGRLDTVLAALSDYYKREHALNETIQRAVTYPCVMTALTALIFLILLRRIFPIFSQVFSLFDSGMSPAASFLLGQNPAGLAILTGAAVALFLVAVLALILFHSRWGLAAFSRGKSSPVCFRHVADDFQWTRNGRGPGTDRKTSGGDAPGFHVRRLPEAGKRWRPLYRGRDRLRHFLRDGGRDADHGISHRHHGERDGGTGQKKPAKRGRAVKPVPEPF